MKTDNCGREYGRLRVDVLSEQRPLAAVSGQHALMACAELMLYRCVPDDAHHF